MFNKTAPALWPHLCRSIPLRSLVPLETEYSRESPELTPSSRMPSTAPDQWIYQPQQQNRWPQLDWYNRQSTGSEIVQIFPELFLQYRKFLYIFTFFDRVLS